MTRMRAAGLAFVALGVAGCGALLGVSDYEGSGATGSGTGGQSAAATAATGQAGAAPGVEVCSNGVDDDGDGAADCADPDCQPGYQCAPAVDPVSGYQGYFRAAQVPFTAAETSTCGGGASPIVFYESLQGTAASCTNCTCGALTGATCTPPTFVLYDSATSCAGTASITDPLGTCKGELPKMTKPELAGVLSGSWAMNGSCTPSTVTVTKNPPWQLRDEVCPVAVGGGCGAGKVCAPKSDGKHPELCVRAVAGTPPCPKGYATELDVYGSFKDTRGCSACNCKPVAGCGGGAVQVYGCDAGTCMAGCGNMPNPQPIPAGGCVDIQSITSAGAWAHKVVAPSVPAGVCNGITTPIGTVVPSEPSAFCCTP